MFTKSIPEQFIKKMKPLDLVSLKLSILFLGVLIAVYFEKIREVNPIIYLILFILFAIKPAMLYVKK
ncbi:hypothetical protein COT95_02490 [Candidatus Falkowbacteria bacterium CG10_big_fil_rev_8_21_14_0_10_37_6]|uniref:Uncharacterized protein n=1 Tax=Candidatus Falkowbacteria bacterium CG10_big_fil_rev_8_21_14_0_10_37_6 TaxID=1974563 RepID=A0A2H0V8U8_9BACT|nr:MAG: hypothetical protein COT95_02490 [Candidatus Falkowbacteria bacterium CG10_big_fil_rev_8_21_14_0_10_37_6]